MIRITVDVFSGVENPNWIIEELEGQKLVQKLQMNQDVVEELDSGFQGLGFRGLILEFLEDGIAEKCGLPESFKLGGGGSPNQQKGIELVEEIIQTSMIDSKVSTILKSELNNGPFLKYTTEKDITPKSDSEGCWIETGKFNPGFWNRPGIQNRNNCYNYATNRRTDTFAQPGRDSGSHPFPMKCNGVMPAAISDGAHEHGNCFPTSEKPRWFMAVVIWPGVDYHWYRKATEGFWGHKPGQTAAKNTDNSGNVIHDPKNCDRGNYTEFCKYMYACKSMNVR